MFGRRDGCRRRMDVFGGVTWMKVSWMGSGWGEAESSIPQKVGLFAAGHVCIRQRHLREVGRSSLFPVPSVPSELERRLVSPVLLLTWNNKNCRIAEIWCFCILFTPIICVGMSFPLLAIPANPPIRKSSFSDLKLSLPLFLLFQSLASNFLYSVSEPSTTYEKVLQQHTHWLHQSCWHTVPSKKKQSPKFKPKE